MEENHITTIFTVVTHVPPPKSNHNKRMRQNGNGASPSDIGPSTAREVGIAADRTQPMARGSF